MFIEVTDIESRNKHLINTEWVEEIIDTNGEVTIYFGYHEDDAAQDFIKVAESYDDIKRRIWR